jgi:hypothetical protein
VTDRVFWRNDVTPKYEQWANWFAVTATFLMFVDFLAGFHRQHAALDWVLIAVFVLLILVVVSLRYLRVASLVNDVYPRFDIGKNLEVWRRVRHKYCYVGVSGATFLSEFRAFASPPKNGLFGTTIHLLLLLPDAELVRESQMHETGQDINVADPSVELTCRRIRDTASAYLSQRGLNIEVRFYSEVCRYWAHFVDDSEVYLSPLLHRQTGLESMVLRLTGGARKNLLVRYYIDEFERLWRNAIPAGEYFKKTKGALD